MSANAAMLRNIESGCLTSHVRLMLRNIESHLHLYMLKHSQPGYCGVALKQERLSKWQNYLPLPVRAFFFVQTLTKTRLS